MRLSSLSLAVLFLALAVPVQDKGGMAVTVRPTDIDVNGHANNARIVEYLQWGRWDWMASRGMSRDDLKAMGVVLVVVHLEVDYRVECGEGDTLAVATYLAGAGEKSITFRQVISGAEDDTRVEAKVVLVAIDPATRKSRTLPDALRNLKAEEAAR